VLGAHVSTDPSWVKRFHNEARAASRLDHPNTVRLIDFGQTKEGLLFIAMEFLHGRSLRDEIDRVQRLPPNRVLRIVSQMCASLSEAHNQGIIHRDIKPDNVILESEGSLKLIDLGVVRIPGLEDAPAEDVPGTPAYMAPEMFAGEPGNEATDLYALGVTMFRAFTGEFPYANPDATAGPRRDRPQALSALRPDLPEWLQATIGRAIARDPADRFRDVADFALEMEAGPPRAPIVARRPLTLYERAPVRFWQGVAALLALALLLLLLKG
jgi:serine/threonine protein kinase